MAEELAYREALCRALHEEMARDESVFVIGEEVGVYGGAYAVTDGLLDEFGAGRVIDTPISEAGIVGLSIGAAITGTRPVAELMYVDFAGMCMDMIANQAAKINYMYGQQQSVPMTLRTQGGTGRSAGAQHSQSLEAWFTHVPGLRVVMPATPADGYGLLKSSIRNDDPVIFIEHKGLYTEEGEVPEDPYTTPLGEANVVREGDDITLLTYSRMLYYSLEAAEELSDEGIEAEVIDLRSLNPLDEETMYESIQKTGRVAVVEEDTKTGGIGAELSARINKQQFEVLDDPVERIAALDIPIPAAPEQEQNSIPTPGRIVRTVKDHVKGASV